MKKSCQGSSVKSVPQIGVVNVKPRENIVLPAIVPIVKDERGPWLITPPKKAAERRWHNLYGWVEYND